MEWQQRPVAVGRLLRVTNGYFQVVYLDPQNVACWHKPAVCPSRKQANDSGIGSGSGFETESGFRRNTHLRWFNRHAE